jgi:hypothetical protein
VPETEAKRVFRVNIKGCLGAVAPGADEAIEVTYDDGVCTGFEKGCSDRRVVPVLPGLLLLLLLLLLMEKGSCLGGVGVREVCRRRGRGERGGRGQGGRSGSRDHDGIECSMEGLKVG